MKIKTADSTGRGVEACSGGKRGERKVRVKARVQFQWTVNEWYSRTSGGRRKNTEEEEEEEEEVFSM